MSITFNPITGNFDEIEIPVKYDVTSPALSVNGDLQVYFDGTNAYLYWQSNGVTYQALGTAG